MTMLGNFDFDVIRRALPYLFFEGMRFTLTLTALAALGGLVFGTLIALMRLSAMSRAPVFMFAPALTSAFLRSSLLCQSWPGSWR